MIVGRALLIIALGVCGIAAGVVGGVRRREDLVASARRATYVLAAAAGEALAWCGICDRQLNRVEAVRLQPVASAAKDTIEESISHSTGATSSV